MSANSEPIKKQFTQKVSTSNEVQVFHFETESALVLITGSQTGQTLDDVLTTLQSSKVITLTGDVTGTATQAANGNWTISTTVSDDSHNHTGGTVSLTAGDRVVVTSAENTLIVSTVTATELGYLSGVTGSIQTQLNAKAAAGHDHDAVYLKLNQLGAANGVAPLGSDTKIPAAYLPTYVDDVKDVYVVGSTPYANDWLSLTSGGEALTPETDMVYNVVSAGDYQNQSYRWSGSAYVRLNEGVVLGETSSTAYRGDRGAIAYNHATSTHARVDATAVAASDNGYISIDGTKTLVYAHPSSSGNYHIPSGGSSGKIIRWLSDGQGTWATETGLSLGATSGNGNAVTGITVDGHEITLVKGSTFLTAHPSTTLQTDTTSSVSPSGGGTFTAVDSVTRDGFGHVTKINTKTVTLPSSVNIQTGSTQPTNQSEGDLWFETISA